MRYAVCSDEIYPINEFVINQLLKLGHEVTRFGALRSGREENWADVAKAAALAILHKECDEGIFFCFTATGISMAANKIPGIRAALCVDAETARNARIWNHANVLALSNRLLSEHVAQEILTAWLTTPFDDKGNDGVMALKAIDDEFRRP